MKNAISIIAAMLLLTSCEKVVDLKYKSNQESIVIEGNITNEPGPYTVKITKSVGLKEKVTNPTIDDAVVTISDNAGNGEQLTPIGNGLYQTTLLTGIEGRTYTLTVVADNITYTAQSIMPAKVLLDSLKVVAEVNAASETEYSLVPIYIDPAAKGNNYRFILSLNGKLINQHLVQNDEIINGAVNTLRLEISEDDLELKKGDTISMQMQCIDNKAALFYTTLVLIGNSGPGGGTTPTNPTNNFSNGALGLFSAHTVQQVTAILP